VKKICGLNINISTARTDKLFSCVHKVSCSGNIDILLCI
jgi:hypothetical protein